jgi:predicted DNA binding CopG/RHH family protein
MNEEKSNSIGVNFWNCNERLIKNHPLTTNALEGYHRSLNNSFRTSHPNFAKFLDFLQKEEKRIKIKIQEVLLGKIKFKGIKNTIKYVAFLNKLNFWISMK